MPFDTVKRSPKRLRPDTEQSVEAANEWYMQPSIYSLQDYHKYNSNIIFPSTPATTPIDIPSTDSNVLLDDIYISPQSNHFWQDDSTTTTTNSPFLIHRPSTCSTINSSPPSLLIDSLNDSVYRDILSKIRLSYTDVGISLDAKITSATEFRSLIDAFSQMCYPSTSNLDMNKQESSMVVYRNKSNQTKPVNFFESTCRLGQIPNPHSSLDSKSRQIADACIDTFFTCWVRYKPIVKKKEFMAWYKAQKNPLDTLIVNAICTYVFRHMVIHHPQPNLVDEFLKDQDKLQEQEEYFFNSARKLLAQSFDSPDRYTILSLLFMSIRAEHSKRHHYLGMATSALHALEIYPRTIDEEPDDYEKELDTRLWWSIWASDFALHTAGAPKNTPQPRYPNQQVDFPQVFEQDIDEDEISVIAYTHCLKLWKIQSDIITTLYEQENCEMTVQQLQEYDRRLLNFYNGLPKYLVFDSGFEYGCDDLFVACLRVNIEYNATRIILHKLFIPEMNDTRPSQASLESLNICLSTALTQLSAIKTCNMGDFGRCAFDRDELWRASEVISVAMDIYYACVSLQDKETILKNIKTKDFRSGLTKSFHVLQNTREFKLSIKNWFQVADWIQLEIRRHQLTNHDQSEEVKEDYFLAQLKPNAILNHLKPASTSSKKSSSRKPVSFQHQFSIQPPPPPSSNNRKPSFSSSSSTNTTTTSFVQFNAYNPHEPSSSGKSTARFRYFNPSKMNKFLFIDEHPII